MARLNGNINLVLSGGGIRGLAYAGVFEAAERKGYEVANISGVSAGALAGAFYGAGCKANELRSILDEFDFSKIKIDNITGRVPAVAEYINMQQQFRGDTADCLDAFLGLPGKYSVQTRNTKIKGDDKGFLDNIVTLSKKGCLFDGDYLEEWVSRILSYKGVHTFADLRGGMADKVNPRGYKVRMTAVDVKRKCIVIIPDDMIYYGIEPDGMEVAKAVRMSTSVPFAFKPVELKVSKDGKAGTHIFVDGGVLDGFPTWLVSNSVYVPMVGFELTGETKHKLLSMNKPLSILKAMISALYNTGVPKHKPVPAFWTKINTHDISFLDFSLDETEKAFLFNAGKRSALYLFDKMDKSLMVRLGSMLRDFMRLK